MTEIHDEMDRVGELMVQLPTREWTSGVLYLLKVLDSQANERGEQYDYLEVLVRISGDIAMRLELELGNHEVIGIRSGLPVTKPSL